MRPSTQSATRLTEIASVAMAMAGARSGRPGIELGACGEHGGDPQSIAVFDRIGLDYVSCSPPRVPGARLAGAQSVLAARADA